MALLAIGIGFIDVRLLKKYERTGLQSALFIRRREK